MGGRGAYSFSRHVSGKWSGRLGPMVPQTLKDALGAKGSPIPIADAIVKTNPHFNRSFREYSENCQRCVVAYEMRRRGYDVTALPTYAGDTLPRVAHVSSDGKIYGRWKGAFRDAKPVNVGVPGNNKKAESGVIGNIEKQMKSFGPGSRGVVQIFYRGGGGHVFNVENSGGRIVYAEAQSGMVKNISKTMNHVDTGTVNLVRTDNLHISERAKNFVTTK